MARGCSPKGVVNTTCTTNSLKTGGRGGKGRGRRGEEREREGRGERGEGRGGRGKVEGGEGRGRKERGRGGEGRKKGAGRGGGVGGRLYVSCKAELTLLPPILVPPSPKCQTLWSSSVHFTDPPLCGLCVVCPYHFGMACSLVIFLRERER